MHFYSVEYPVELLWGYTVAYSTTYSSAGIPIQATLS